jgi:hypothetical protein
MLVATGETRGKNEKLQPRQLRTFCEALAFMARKAGNQIVISHE